jgi:hypothetical protein
MSDATKITMAQAVTLIDSDPHSLEVTGEISYHLALGDHCGEVDWLGSLHSCHDSRRTQWAKTSLPVERATAGAASRVCVRIGSAKLLIRLRSGHWGGAIDGGGSPD